MEELNEEFEEAWSKARALVDEGKWNTQKVYVLNRFGKPIIEAFVEEHDWENLRDYNQQFFQGIKVVFSKLSTWNPAYEN